MERVRNRHLFVSDLVLIPLAAYVSFILRLDTFRIGGAWSALFFLLIPALLLFPCVFRFAGMYSCYWQYASVDESVRLAGAVALAAGAASTFYLIGTEPSLLGAVSPASISITVIFFFVALSVTVGPRLAVRMANSGTLRRRKTSNRRTLIVGAGETGRVVLRELQRNPQLGITPVGFLDDDPRKRCMHISGIAVVATCSELVEIARLLRVEYVIIAMPSASGKLIRSILSSCEDLGVTPQIMPGLDELIDGKLNIGQLRPVEVEDLLRRDPIVTDLDGVDRLLRGKRVLVTGAGGSIGSELCRQILRCAPAELVLLGHGENSIFAIHNELRERQSSSSTTIHSVIADVRFPADMQAVFSCHRPHVVFHAAAHKHVPLMELNPATAVHNNVFGTQAVLDAARDADVERFVFVSTDKAVNPTSVMGATKRAAELLVHRAARETGRPYIVTRFGNVLGSRGSVVLTMKQQIASGGPVTVTHPDMVRYFMTIPEAVQLVLQAAVLGHGGEVFVFDMGELVRIVDLAHDLIRLSGLTLGEDVEVVYSGIRPGEKLYEELFLPDECYERTAHAKVFTAANASVVAPGCLDAALGVLARAVQRMDNAGVRNALRQLVPEYTPRGSGEEGRELAPAGGRGARRSADRVRASAPLPGIVPLASGDGH